MKTPTEAKDASRPFCPNLACPARGKTGAGNVVIHDRSRQRYRCTVCRRTFSARQGTMLEGLRKPTEIIIIVVTLLSYGCPVQAIVQAYGLDERTVARWRDRAGEQCQRVHAALVEQGELDLVHVQADEIRVKGRQLIAWMGLAMMVSTRLWLAGVVQERRDHHLADALLGQVRRCAKLVHALLVLTDGWAAYPKSIRRAFRVKVKTTPGVGRASLQVWSGLRIGTVIKRQQPHRLLEVSRQMALGTLSQAKRLLARSGGGSVLNTAFIERLNATFRERLATLTRKSRHAAARVRCLQAGMYLVGCTYNFCVLHHELSKATHLGQACTPAMASGLTDHLWSVGELLLYRHPPAPWVDPPGRRRAKPVPSPAPLRPQTGSQGRLRLHKGALCLTTA